MNINAGEILIQLVSSQYLFVTGSYSFHHILFSLPIIFDIQIQGHSMGFDQIQFNGTLLPFTGAYSGGWQSKARAFLCLLRLLTFAQNGKCLC